MVIKIGTGNAGAQSLRLGDAARTARYAAEAKAAAEKAERSAGIAAGALQDTADNARRAEAAAAASVHPPVPGTGGTWLIWDQKNGGYIDSGENCRGEKGETGGRGEKGDKGDAFSYADFTPAQLEALRGPQGIQGETGPAGPTGATGAEGPKGDKGDTGATGPAPDMSAYRTAAAQDVIDEAQNAEIADLKSAINDPVTGLAAKAPVIFNTTSGAIACFTDGADSMPIKKLVANIEPVQTGTGDPSPENIRPISGWTGANVTRTGKNLFRANNWENNNAGLTVIDNNSFLLSSTTYVENKNKYLLPKTGAYTISFHVKVIAIVDHAASVGLFAYDDTPSVVSSIRIAVPAQGAENDYVLQIPANANQIRFAEWAYSARIELSNIQLELGSTATAYEPYTGNQISVNWETEAGTVYGGEDEVISGKLTDNMKSVKVSDLPVNVPFEVGTHACWKRFTLPATCKPVLYNQYHGSISSMGTEALAYYGAKHISEAGAIDVDYAINPGGQYLAVYDSDLSLTDATFMEKYGDMQVVYPLAEPVEYTLTENEMGTLYGTNNIWADTGDVSVDYPADTKLYIDNKITQAIANALNS